ncbi:hypothetical protein BSLG_005990 [Batrachochytrium salamandrivorans]|nr:hypothetical protein BSLG_005990 [Batrachochytrium salamandrivorans]
MTQELRLQNDKAIEKLKLSLDMESDAQLIEARKSIQAAEEEYRKQSQARIDALQEKLVHKRLRRKPRSERLAKSMKELKQLQLDTEQAARDEKIDVDVSMAAIELGPLEREIDLRRQELVADRTKVEGLMNEVSTQRQKLEDEKFRTL